MSYDVFFVADTVGGNTVEVGSSLNYTYNCSAMFRKALGRSGIHELHKKTAADVLPLLRVAVSHISDPDNIDEYTALNPISGWGDYTGAKKFLEDILLNAAAYPEATIIVS